MKVKNLFCRAIALSCVLAWSGSAWAAGAMSGPGQITELWMPVTGDVLKIRFSEPIQNPDGCGNATAYIVELDNSVGSNRFVSMAISAFEAKQPVRFWVHGCTTNLHSGATWPTPTAIYVEGN
jgi:hypothetical protein